MRSKQKNTSRPPKKPVALPLDVHTSYAVRAKRTHTSIERLVEDVLRREAVGQGFYEPQSAGSL